MLEKRKVRQVYVDGTPKQEFESIRDAAKAMGRESPYARTHIIDVCRGRRKTAFGYKWEYINQEETI